ncbi:HTH-type transcriptional regulator CynR [Pararobbsia alpina]|uniref:LysR substrate-binding domain-containing protein n=1 Tax=Pararobbsia alpina TaxID=621374 RepID=UPI0039A45791
MNPSAIDLRLLRSFVATAKLGSATRAANALHLTQPALSQHLRELANLLDAQLFDRVGRGIALTSAGEHLFRDIEPALDQLDFALTSLQARATEVRGSLRVGAIDTYARALVIPAVTELIAQHPQLRIEVVEIPAPAIDVALLSGDLDVGVAFSLLSNDRIEQRPLFEETLMLIQRRRRNTRLSHRATLAEVARQPLALLNRDFAMRRQIDRVFAAESCALDVRVEAANVDSLMRLAEASELATVASGLAVRDHKRVVVRAIAHGGLKRAAALRWRRGRSASPAVQSFSQALAKQIERVRETASLLVLP